MSVHSAASPVNVRAPAGTAIHIHASRWKYALLALPCAYLALVGGSGLAKGMGDRVLDFGLVGFGLLAAAVLLYMGFDRRPVLSIDAEGIRCRRPNLGLLPWRAVAGLGLGRAAFARNVLIIAIDESELAPEAAERLKRERSSVLAGPEATRYRGDMAGHPTVSVSLALLAVSPRRLQRILEDEIRYDGEAH
jgi:hypothetical protein